MNLAGRGFLQSDDYWVFQASVFSDDLIHFIEEVTSNIVELMPAGASHFIGNAGLFRHGKAVKGKARKSPIQVSVVDAGGLATTSTSASVSSMVYRCNVDGQEFLSNGDQVALIERAGYQAFVVRRFTLDTCGGDEDLYRRLMDASNHFAKSAHNAAGVKFDPDYEHIKLPPHGEYGDITVGLTRCEAAGVVWFISDMEPTYGYHKAFDRR